MTKEELREIFKESEQEITADVAIKLLEELKQGKGSDNKLDEADIVVLAFKISKEFNFNFLEKVLRRFEIIS